MTRRGMVLEGLEGLEQTLDLGVRQARNLNRSTIHAVAGKVRNDARKNAPEDTKTLKKAIVSKRRRPRDPDKPFSDVMVTHGNNAKHDAYYWRFIEYGTVDQPANPFFQPAINAIRPDIPAIYRKEFAKKYAAYLKRQAKKRAAR